MLGERIHKYRLQRGLTLEDVAKRCEVTKGYISLIERDVISPTIDILMKMLQLFNVDTATFFKDKEQLVYTDENWYVQQVGEIRVTDLAPGNNISAVMVDMDPDTHTEWFAPHDGRSFGYVLAGVVQIEVGARTARAHKGESFCFETNEHYQFKNTGKLPCKFIWMKAR